MTTDIIKVLKDLKKKAPGKQLSLEQVNFVSLACESRVHLSCHAMNCTCMCHPRVRN